MKDVTWNRPDVVSRLRRDIWRHLTQTAQSEQDMVFEAARLLQMPATAVRTLAQLHFVLTKEVGALLTEMPMLIRRLSATTAFEREVSAERLRGSIQWTETYAMRAAAGLPHLYVTRPTRRAFDTPENELLVFALNAIAQFGRLTGWDRSTSKGVGEIIRARVNEAIKWRHARALSDIQVRSPSQKTIARVRGSRKRRLYESTLRVVELHQEFIARLDRKAIQGSVEDHALVTRQDPVLLELLCAFEAMAALQQQGWRGVERPLVGGGLLFKGVRADETLELFYQRMPKALNRDSYYRTLQVDHALGVGGMIPDLVVLITKSSEEVRWLLVEIKGVERTVADSARAAATDLLAYRRALAPVLDSQDGPYGIGVAWGAELKPAVSEVTLCSPDTLGDALRVLIDG